VRGSFKKSCPGATALCGGCAAFLHNVVMGALDCSFGNGTLIAPITPHYVKKLGRKNYWRKSRSVRVIAPITVTVIFLGALAKEWQLK